MVCIASNANYNYKHNYKYNYNINYRYRVNGFLRKFPSNSHIFVKK